MINLCSLGLAKSKCSDYINLSLAGLQIFSSELPELIVLEFIAKATITV